jgi:hypothetical protein
MMIAVAGVAATVGAGAIATAPASFASQPASFRLSNFASVVANVCVHTDIAVKCTGNITAGVSRVIKVDYNNPGNWYCTAKVPGGPRDDTPRFSRANVKECAGQGNVWQFNIETK